MEALHGPAAVITSDIEQFAAAYPNPGGRPWSSQVDPGQERGSYTVRTWDGLVRDGHLCWVQFDVQESGPVSQVNTSLCAPGHNAERVQHHIYKYLWQTYGSH